MLGSLALPLLVPESWMDYAACTTRDPDLFFEPYQERRAAAVCRSCSVREQCLDFGLTEAYGVWGGYDSDERNAIRKKRGAKRPRPSWGHPGGRTSVASEM